LTRRTNATIAGIAYVLYIVLAVWLIVKGVATREEAR